MNAILKADDLTQAGFIELIGALVLPQGDKLRLWAEGPDGWVLSFWPGLAGSLDWCGAGRDPVSVPAGECLARVWAGRLFAPSGELRWRVIPTLGERCCRTVFLGNTDWLPGRLRPRTELEALPSRAQERYLLWGQQTAAAPAAWVELRIPHHFRYPVPTPGRGVRAVVEVWSDRFGELHLVRLCDLEPFSEGP